MLCPLGSPICISGLQCHVIGLHKTSNNGTCFIKRYGSHHFLTNHVCGVASYWWRKKHSGESHPTPSAPKHKRFFNSFGKKGRKEDHAFTFSNSIEYRTPYFNQSGAKKKNKKASSLSPLLHSFIHFFFLFSFYVPTTSNISRQFFFLKIIILFINNKIVTFVSCQ